MAGTGIFGIIVSKLRNRKKPCLIILLKVDKSLELGFHYTILSFSLAIHLQVKDNEESPLDAKEIA